MTRTQLVLTVIAASLLLIGCSRPNSSIVDPARADASTSDASTSDGAVVSDASADVLRDAPMVCGECLAGEVCGGGGVANVCGCQPQTCADLGALCGTAADGCGGTLECGTCVQPETCGGLGVANECGCGPTNCAAVGADCGSVPDGCADTLDCGGCAALETCGDSSPNVCGCTPTTCSAAGLNCGSLPDGCSGVLDCGVCANGQTCGGGGVANVCGVGPCVPGSCADVGATCGTISDGCAATLDCGVCALPETCGGGMVANTCGCRPTTCVAEGATCGSIGDGCGGSLNCGVCTSPQTCGGAGVPNTCGDPNPCTFASVSTGRMFTCAVSTGGRLYCWGLNDEYQLGVGDVDARLLPTPVDNATDWASVTAGLFFACAVKTDGTLWCWGKGSYGVLGQGDLDDETVPRQVGTAADWRSVEAATQHVCGLRTGGQLYCWGRNWEKQVSDSTSVSVRTPEQIEPGELFLSVGPGGQHTCAVRADGTLWCWGANRYGELGQGNEGAGTWLDVPTQVGAATDWSQPTGGEFSACAVKATGSLWCWGAPGRELGLGPLAGSVLVPTQVVGGPVGWAHVAMTEIHTCGIGTDGSLWCWGYNRAGVLGTGDEVPSDVPVRVGSDVGWVSAEPNVGLHTFGGFGSFHACGIRDTGLYCWGSNRYGQLATGDNAERLSPFESICDCLSSTCACGDGVCDTGVEQCTSCIDCDTRAAVCGNGECAGTETSANCEADCGPSPWPVDWVTFESEVVALINMYRASGTTCPSGAAPPVPALTSSSALETAARLHAWDLSTGNYFSHDSCNGRQPADRASAAGVAYNGEVIGNGYTTADAVVNGWLASDAHCSILMDAAHTSLGAGHATVTGQGYGMSRWVVMFN